MNTFQLIFATFAFLSQTLLILNFSALKWSPAIQQKWGWVVYATALVAFPLAIVFWANEQDWYLGLAFILFTAWAVFGAIVDIVRPVNWRMPIRWPIFLPYLILYLAAQFAFWIPLWFIGPGYWIGYAVLYTVSTVLNISNHFKPKASQPS